MTHPLVSIIIPIFNRSMLIGETLNSVLAQTYHNWECIVVDDGSTDATEAVIKEFVGKDARIKYYKRPKNKPKGANACRNYGFEVSKGAYINWLDSDDLISNTKLEIQLKELEETGKNVCVSLGRLFTNNPLDERQKLWNEVKVKYDQPADSLILEHARWPTGALLCTREAANQLSWDERLQGAQEWLYHCLMALTLKPTDFCFLDTVVLHIRTDNDSITRKASTTYRYEAYLYARIILLEYLYEHCYEDFFRYYHAIYVFSVRYIKYLIRVNRFKNIIKLSRFMSKISFSQAIYFYFGVIVFKFFKKDYFLKHVVT